jgi:hypothetical protein
MLCSHYLQHILLYELDDKALETEIGNHNVTEL